MDVKMARAMEVKAVREVVGKVDALDIKADLILARLERIESLLAELSAGRIPKKGG